MDAAAISFYFPAKGSACGDYKDPLVSLTINRSLPRTAPRIITFEAGDDSAFASRCIDRQRCEPAVSGTFTLDRFEPNKAASGSYLLRFKDGTIEKGRFKARGCDVKAVCR